jgi:hypothetical protein
LYRTALIIALLAFLSLNIFSQEKPKTNLEIFEETISVELEKFYYYPGVNRDAPFIFVINPDEKGGANKNTESGSKFLNSLVKKTASSNNLKFSIADNVSQISADTAYNLLVLQVLNLETRYSGFKKNKFLGEKTLSRNIIINIAVELKAVGGSLNVNDYIKYNITGEAAYDNYKQLESPLYDFTQGEAPKVSAFERIIFPVLLICVTAAATILFFTIRSK